MPDKPFRSYMICTTPRSGSTLLCRMLAATNEAGKPDSHFHVPSFKRWLTNYDVEETDFATREQALRAVFKKAQARGTGDTNIFGLRMQRGSFDFFMQQLALLEPEETGDVKKIESVFGSTLFIHLSRPDRIDQAISRVRAEQTGLWHRNSDGTELERLAPSKKAYYDAEAIERTIAELAQLDEAWERWFEQEALTPLRISYGSLSSDPKGTLAKVLSALNVDPSRAVSVEPPTAKLADAKSRQWRERFEANS